MLQILILIMSCLFKASGSFWALRLAHECFQLAQNDGWYLFYYLPALILVVVAAVVVIDSATECMMIWNIIDGNEDVH